MIIISSLSFLFDHHESLGKKGERLAGSYLKKKGFRILETNYRNPTGKQLGEIDIVAQKEGVIIFVEVKTRQGDPKNTFPEDNLTPAKLGKLERIATHFLQSKNLRDAPYHFDAVTVLFDANHKASFQHFEHLFF